MTMVNIIVIECESLLFTVIQNNTEVDVSDTGFGTSNKN